ncbi:hypothetical protein ABKN59_004415 [Abortiporus biennis]
MEKVFGTNDHRIKLNDKESADVSLFHCHGMITARVRKPLWDYKKAIDLIKSSKDIVHGLHALAETQVSHRDIGPGSVFIEEHLVPRHDEKGTMVEIHGFIADFEYAYIPRMGASDSSNHTIETVATTVNSILSMDKMDAKTLKSKSSVIDAIGPVMTGSLQFVALEVLHASYSNKSIPKTPFHHLESFVWVLFYVLYRHAYTKMNEDSGKRKLLGLEFHHHFGSNNFGDVIVSRENILNQTKVSVTELLGAFRQFGRKDKVLLLMVSELLQQVQASYPAGKPMTSIFDGDSKMKDGTSTTDSEGAEDLEDPEDSDLNLTALRIKVNRMSQRASHESHPVRDLDRFNHETVMNTLVSYSGLFKSS